MTQEVISKTLHNAAYNGNIKELKRLLGSGIEINTRNEKGNTCLIPAVVGPKSKSTKLKVIEFLVENSIDINAINNEGDTILHTVVRVSNWRKIPKEIVRRLIDYGANRKMKNSDGLEPFRLAFQEQHSKLGSLLIFYEVKKHQCSSCRKRKGLFGYFGSRSSSKDTVSSCSKEEMDISNRHRSHIVTPATIMETSLLMNKKNSTSGHYSTEENQKGEKYIVPSKNERDRIYGDESPPLNDESDIVIRYKEENIEPRSDEYSRDSDQKLCATKRDSNPYASIDKAKKREIVRTGIVYSNALRVMGNSNKSESVHKQNRDNKENFNDPRGGIVQKNDRETRLYDRVEDDDSGSQDDRIEREVEKSSSREDVKEEIEHSAYETADD